MNTLKLNWENFKSEIVLKNLIINYVDCGFYHIYAVDGIISYYCDLEKGTDDAVDFENNYMSLSNIKLSSKSPEYRSEIGKFFEHSCRVCDINSGSFFEVSSSSISSDRMGMITDFLVSSNVDGEWRFKYNGGVVCGVFNESYRPCYCGRRSPFPVSASGTISFEFCPVSDGATVVVNYGGYLL